MASHKRSESQSLPTPGTLTWHYRQIVSLFQDKDAFSDEWAMAEAAAAERPEASTTAAIPLVAGVLEVTAALATRASAAATA